MEALLNATDSVIWLQTVCRSNRSSQHESTARDNHDDTHAGPTSQDHHPPDDHHHWLYASLEEYYFVCDMVVLASPLVVMLPDTKLLPCGHDNLLFLPDLFPHHHSSSGKSRRHGHEPHTDNSNKVLLQMSLSNCFLVEPVDADSSSHAATRPFRHAVDASPETYEWSNNNLVQEQQQRHGHSSDAFAPLVFQMTVTFNLTSVVMEQQQQLLLQRDGRIQDETSFAATKDATLLPDHKNKPLVTFIHHGMEPSAQQQPHERVTAEPPLASGEETKSHRPVDKNKVAVTEDYRHHHRQQHEAQSSSPSPSRTRPASSRPRHEQQSSSSSSILLFPPTAALTTPAMLRMDRQNRLALKRMVETELYEMNCILTGLAVVAAVLVLLLMGMSWRGMKSDPTWPSSKQQQQQQPEVQPVSSSLCSSTTTTMKRPTAIVPNPDDGTTGFLVRTNTKLVSPTNDTISPLSLGPSATAVSDIRSFTTTSPATPLLPSAQQPTEPFFFLPRARMEHQEQQQQQHLLEQQQQQQQRGSSLPTARTGTKHSLGVMVTTTTNPNGDDQLSSFHRLERDFNNGKLTTKPQRSKKDRFVMQPVSSASHLRRNLHSYHQQQQQQQHLLSSREHDNNDVHINDIIHVHHAPPRSDEYYDENTIPPLVEAPSSSLRRADASTSLVDDFWL